MAPSAAMNSTALNTTAAEAFAHIYNVTRALSGVLNTTAAHNITQASRPPASNAFCDAFAKGILVVHTVVLGVLLVLSAITLFHCRAQAKKDSAGKDAAAEQKLAELTAKVIDLKGRLVEVADAVERVEESVAQRDERRVGTPIWEAEILKRIKGI